MNLVLEKVLCAETAQCAHRVGQSEAHEVLLCVSGALRPAVSDLLHPPDAHLHLLLLHLQQHSGARALHRDGQLHHPDFEG